MNGRKAAPLTWLTVSSALLAAGCSPLYITQAVYQESLILLKRRSISEVIANPNTPTSLKNKLQLVLDARAFAAQIGLDPGGSFTKYTQLDQDVLTWVLAASRPDAFELKQWWFPFVGRIPYQGFFAKADALSAAAALQEQGYETSIRGADAFSTLGWFSDPVLSTTLKRSDPSIIETVLHESTHSTLWLPGHVDFNESFANFVGLQGTLDYYEAKLKKCSESACASDMSAAHRLALEHRTRQFELGGVISKLYQQLDLLYKSDLSKEEKLSRRVLIFEEETAGFRARYPQRQIFTSINNADIIQLKLYFTALDEFEALYKKQAGDWPLFFSAARRIMKESRQGQPPFALLKQEALSDLQP